MLIPPAITCPRRPAPPSAPHQRRKPTHIFFRTEVSRNVAAKCPPDLVQKTRDREPRFGIVSFPGGQTEETARQLLEAARNHADQAVRDFRVAQGLARKHASINSNSRSLLSYNDSAINITFLALLSSMSNKSSRSAPC